MLDVAEGFVDAFEDLRRQDGQAGALGVADGLVADQFNAGLASGAGDLLGGTVIGRIGPAGVVGDERGLGKIEGALCGAVEFEERDRDRGFALGQAGAVQPETQAPVAAFGAGGFFVIGAVENTGIGARPKARASRWFRPVAKRRGEQPVQAIGVERQAGLGFFKDVFSRD